MHKDNFKILKITLIPLLVMGLLVNTTKVLRAEEPTSSTIQKPGDTNTIHKLVVTGVTEPVVGAMPKTDNIKVDRDDVKLKVTGWQVEETVSSNQHNIVETNYRPLKPNDKFEKKS